MEEWSSKIDVFKGTKLQWIVNKSENLVNRIDNNIILQSQNLLKN